MSSRTIRSFSVLPLIILVLASVPAVAEVLVSYDHYVYALGSGLDPISDEAVLMGSTQWSADPSMTGHPEVGNYGAATYSADLATGRVATVAVSQGYRDDDLWPHGFTARGRVTENRMKDMLVFSVPAGTYPEGVDVSLHGRFEGTVSSELGAGVQFQMRVRLGLQIHDIDLQTIGVDDAGSMSFDQEIHLTETLVDAGDELTTDTDFSLDVEAYIANCIAWSTDYNTGSGYTSGYAEAQLGGDDQGIFLTVVETPPGVVWTSSSGIFLSEATSVPLAAAAAGPRLGLNYPNPFNPSTRLRFELPAPGAVTLGIYGLDGALVRTLASDEIFTAGWHTKVWDGCDDAGRPVPSGMYVSRIRTAQGEDGQSLLLVK